MDELTDWLADARYSQSLMDGSHKPMKQIPLPPFQPLPQTFITNLDWSVDAIFSQPLGRYFLGRFIQEEHPDKVWLHQFLVTCYELEESEIAGDLRLCLSTLDTLIKQEQCHQRYPAAYSKMQEEVLSTIGTKTATTNDDVDARENNEQKHRKRVLTAIQPLRDAMHKMFRDGTTSLLYYFLSTGVTVTPPSSSLRVDESVQSESSQAESTQSSSTMVMSTSTAEEKQQQQQQQQQQTTTSKRNTLSKSLVVFDSADALEHQSGKVEQGATQRSSKRSNNNVPRIGRYIVPEQLPENQRTIDRSHGIPWLDKYVETLWWSQRPMRIDDMAVFRDIGRGAFGIVSGVTCVYTGKMFALKAMDRKLIKGKKASSLVMQEYEILRVLVERPSKFVVALHYSFADVQNIYLCLNLLTGGDLRFHLSNVGTFNANQTKFFVAQIALGISHLHTLGILYRDLKPENIMLDEKGNCVITDLGLAVRLGKDKPCARGRTGTSGYWAPEVLSKQKYAYAADWWSLGVLMYELLVGMGPFSRRMTGFATRDEGTEKSDIKYDIPRLQKAATVNTEVGKEAATSNAVIKLLSSLMDRNPETRLSDISSLMASEWYHNYDWYSLRRGLIPAPFIPEGAGAINAENAQEIAEASVKKRNSFKGLTLEEKDDLKMLWCVASKRHQLDIVEVLEMERKGELDHLEAITNGCCVIL